MAANERAFERPEPKVQSKPQVAASGWAYHGVMIPDLDAPHRYWTMSIGQPGRRGVDNDHLDERIAAKHGDVRVRDRGDGSLEAYRAR